MDIKELYNKDPQLEMEVSNMADVLYTMKRDWHKWSPEEEKYVRVHFEKMSDKEMAAFLGRKPGAVANRRNRMGIYRQTHNTQKLRLAKLQLLRAAQVRQSYQGEPFIGIVCPRCGKEAIRRLLTLECYDCGFFVFVGTKEYEEKVEKLQKGACILCQSRGTDRWYTARKMECGRSDFSVITDKKNWVVSFENFLDLFTIDEENLVKMDRVCV